MKTYKKLHLIVDAIHYDSETSKQAIEYVIKNLKSEGVIKEYEYRKMGFNIKDKFYRTHFLQLGDWLVKNEKGQIAVYSNEVFESKYIVE